jgi:uncharacterized membrane protein YuzA (DUF378 family)
MCCKKLCPACSIACILVLVGALNWGLVGLGMLMGSSWNLVNMLLGSWPMVEAVVYVLVGVAAVFKVVMMPKCCGKSCGAGACCAGGNCASGSCGTSEAPKA